MSASIIRMRLSASAPAVAKPRRAFPPYYSHRPAHVSAGTRRLISDSPSSRAQHAEPSRRDQTDDIVDELVHINGVDSTTSAAPVSNRNPYKHGQSALDKAGHFFFFTEILRGTLSLILNSFHWYDVRP